MGSAFTAFRSSIHGFKFDNGFPAEAVMAEIYDLPGWIVPDDSWGLCGGMCFASLDRYFSRQPVPASRSKPVPGTPLFSELVERQIDTVNSVGWKNVLNYQIRPDQGSWATTLHSLGYLTKYQWHNNIRPKLIQGIPVTVCLINTGHYDPNIGNNHQVVVWGYNYDPGTDRLSLYAYDPNYPEIDKMVISLRLRQKNNKLSIIQYYYNNDGWKRVKNQPRGFLLVPYDRHEQVISSVKVPVATMEENLEWLWTLLA